MKNKLLSILFLFMMTELFAEKMIIAPIIVYDQTSSRINSEIIVEEYLYRELYSYWFEGLLSFDLLTERDYGDVYTVLDANKVCVNTNSDYALYGYVQKNDNSWFANLKLYGKNEKKIIKEFFSSDEIKEYERLLKYLKDNVMSGIQELIGINAILQEPEEIPLKIVIPISLCYWNPIDKDWSTVFTGIVGTDGGIEIYPKKVNFTIFGVLVDFSFGVNLSYALAIGKENLYPLNYHAVSIASPIMSHLHFNTDHSVYFGVNPFYEMEILEITEKYEDPDLHFQNMFGIQFITGYEYTLKKTISLKTDIKVDFHFCNKQFISIKPGIGAVIYFNER